MNKADIIISNFHDIEILKDLSNNFYCATDLINFYNKTSNTKKVLAEFWSNNNTKQIYSMLCQKLNVNILHTSYRGKKGATWMHESLLEILYNWVYKIPNKTITRDEIVFCEYIIESFKSFLTFEKQKQFGGYFVDLYCNELNLCIEFDEQYHKTKGINTRDINRQNDIENTYKVTFIRHNYADNYSLTINKILKQWTNLK